MNLVFNEKHGPLLRYYRRPPDSPLLLRFSTSFKPDSLEVIRINIENTFGPAIAIWEEEVESEDANCEVMLTLSKGGSLRTTDTTHFIYAFFTDYPIVSNKVRLFFDLIFIGNVDHWFLGGIGQNSILVRRVFENSPEYSSRKDRFVIY